MPIQTSYNEQMPRGVAGMIANTNQSDVDSCIVETAAGIGFGLAVGQGAAEKGIVLGGAITIFRGVTVRDPTLVHSEANVDKYTLGETAAVCFKGDIWVQPGVAVLVTDPVHYVTATGVFAITGGSGPIPGARWLSGGNGVPCKLRLSGELPVP